MIRRLSTKSAHFDAELKALLAIEAEQDASIERTVLNILADIRQRGDTALLEFTRQFDRLDVHDAHQLELPRAELDNALAGLSHEQRDALETAAQRIRDFHQRQRAEGWTYTEADGTELGQRVTPLDRVGLYVPGGKAAYPSSVLMNAIPAKVAGVAEVVMVVPTLNTTFADAYRTVQKIFVDGGLTASSILKSPNECEITLNCLA